MSQEDVKMKEVVEEAVRKLPSQRMSLVGQQIEAFVREGALEAVYKVSVVEQFAEQALQMVWRIQALLSPAVQLVMFHLEVRRWW